MSTLPLSAIIRMLDQAAPTSAILHESFVNFAWNLSQCNQVYSFLAPLKISKTGGLQDRGELIC